MAKKVELASSAPKKALASNGQSEKSNGKARTISEVRALARVLRQYDLSEIEVEDEGLRIRLRAGGYVEPGYRLPAAVDQVPPVDAAAEDDSDEGPTITSPFVGTFYLAASPEADPYVKAGQEVGRGQTLCIVEAMKLMNEIEAEHDCRIVEILVHNGDAVEYGQALFRILPK